MTNPTIGPANAAKYGFGLSPIIILAATEPVKSIVAANDKSKLSIPGSYESRYLYYESCRGLEAWSVACFAIDKFFNLKRQESDAEKFLIEDLFLNQNNEQRKSMYAATWALMALTRVIDTLYIQINDKNSEFGKLVVDYMNLKNKNVRELK